MICIIGGGESCLLYYKKRKEGGKASGHKIKEFGNQQSGLCR